MSLFQVGTTGSRYERPDCPACWLSCAAADLMARSFTGRLIRYMMFGTSGVERRSALTRAGPNTPGD
jgi:hypothetical protein